MKSTSEKQQPQGLSFKLGKGNGVRSLANNQCYYWGYPDWAIVHSRVHNLTVAAYSLLNGSKQLFASTYMTYLPSEEELRQEIERQKEIFYLQRKEAEDEE